MAFATFDTSASELRFDSTITLELTETPLPNYALASGADTYPFRYSDDERPDLFGGLTRQYPSDDLGPWMVRFLKSPGSTNTMTLLDSMTRGIKEDFAYVRRSEKGVQSPGETFAAPQRQLSGTSRCS